MRHAIVLLATLTLTSLQACIGKLKFMGPDVTIQLEGTVTAADDGTPIRGAPVRVDPRFISSRGVAETLTDVSGRYSLSFEQEGCNDLFPLSLDVTANLFFGSSVGIRCRDRPVSTQECALVKRKDCEALMCCCTPSGSRCTRPSGV